MQYDRSTAMIGMMGKLGVTFLAVFTDGGVHHAWASNIFSWRFQSSRLTY